VRVAAVILVLDEEKIIEQGSHQKLQAQQGCYARLIQKQLDSGESIAP
jgi:ABC-type multidrug transport system fused ATPase/permease subunit